MDDDTNKIITDILFQTIFDMLTKIRYIEYNNFDKHPNDIFMYIKNYKDIKIKYNEIYDLLNKTNTPDYQKLITEISQFRKTLQTLLIDAPLENNVSFFNKILKSIVYRPVKYDLYVLTKLSDKLEDCLILLRQLSNKT